MARPGPPLDRSMSLAAAPSLTLSFAAGLPGSGTTGGAVAGRGAHKDAASAFEALLAGPARDPATPGAPTPAATITGAPATAASAPLIAPSLPAGLAAPANALAQAKVDADPGLAANDTPTAPPAPDFAPDSPAPSPARSGLARAAPSTASTPSAKAAKIGPPGVSVTATALADAAPTIASGPGPASSKDAASPDPATAKAATAPGDDKKEGEDAASTSPPLDAPVPAPPPVLTTVDAIATSDPATTASAVPTVGKTALSSLASGPVFATANVFAPVAVAAEAYAPSPGPPPGAGAQAPAAGENTSPGANLQQGAQPTPAVLASPVAATAPQGQGQAFAAPLAPDASPLAPSLATPSSVPVSSARTAAVSTRSGRFPTVGANPSAPSGASSTQPTVATTTTTTHGASAGNRRDFAGAETSSLVAAPGSETASAPVSAAGSPSASLPALAAGIAAQPAAPSANADPAGPAQTTVANLSAQIVTQSGGKTSRFDLQLDPLGLGRVDVAVQIDAKGRASASLSFEKSDSASLLQSHVDALSDALTQAGLSVAPGAISFNHVRPEDAQSALAASSVTHQGADGSFSGGGQGSGQGSGQNAGQNLAQTFSQNSGGQGTGGQDRAPSPFGVTGSRAFDAASDAATATDQQLAAYRTLAPRGVDIRI